MKIKSILWLATVLFLAAPISAFAQMPCEAKNVVTGARVEGECDEDQFSGKNVVTGNYVAGDCTFGGRVVAVEDKTNEQVVGTCGGP